MVNARQRLGGSGACGSENRFKTWGLFSESSQLSCDRLLARPRRTREAIADLSRLTMDATEKKSSKRRRSEEAAEKSEGPYPTFAKPSIDECLAVHRGLSNLHPEVIERVVRVLPHRATLRLDKVSRTPSLSLPLELTRINIRLLVPVLPL